MDTIYKLKRTEAKASKDWSYGEHSGEMWAGNTAETMRGIGTMRPMDAELMVSIRPLIPGLLRLWEAADMSVPNTHAMAVITGKEALYHALIELSEVSDCHDLP